MTDEELKQVHVAAPAALGENVLRYAPAGPVQLTAPQRAEVLRDLDACKQRIADLKFALGDNAGWFDRAMAAEKERDRLRLLDRVTKPAPPEVPAPDGDVADVGMPDEAWLIRVGYELRDTRPHYPGAVRYVRAREAKLAAAEEEAADFDDKWGDEQRRRVELEAKLSEANGLLETSETARKMGLEVEEELRAKLAEAKAEIARLKEHTWPRGLT